MNQSPSYISGKKMLTVGLILSPSIPFLLYRMSQGFNGYNMPGFGHMELVLWTPFYSLLVIISIILIGKGLEKMKSTK